MVKPRVQRESLLPEQSPCPRSGFAKHLTAHFSQRKINLTAHFAEWKISAQNEGRDGSGPAACVTVRVVFKLGVV